MATQWLSTSRTMFLSYVSIQTLSVDTMEPCHFCQSGPGEGVPPCRFCLAPRSMMGGSADTPGTCLTLSHRDGWWAGEVLCPDCRVNLFCEALRVRDPLSQAAISPDATCCQWASCQIPTQISQRKRHDTAGTGESWHGDHRCNYSVEINPISRR